MLARRAQQHARLRFAAIAITYFAEFRMVIAFGRGFMATFVHSLLAMIQGVFLMRLVVERPAPVGGSRLFIARSPARANATMLARR